MVRIWLTPSLPLSTDVIYGWSLGGLLLLRVGSAALGFVLGRFRYVALLRLLALAQLGLDRDELQFRKVDSIHVSEIVI